MKPEWLSLFLGLDLTIRSVALPVPAYPRTIQAFEIFDYDGGKDVFRQTEVSSSRRKVMMINDHKRLTIIVLIGIVEVRPAFYRCRRVHAV
jgi:hypothetical protein